LIGDALSQKAPRSPLWLTKTGSGLLPQDTSRATHANDRSVFKPNAKLTDDEERVKDAALEHVADRFGRDYHGVRFVSGTRAASSSGTSGRFNSKGPSSAARNSAAVARMRRSVFPFR